MPPIVKLLRALLLVNTDAGFYRTIQHHFSAKRRSVTRIPLHTASALIPAAAAAAEAAAASCSAKFIPFVTSLDSAVELPT